ALGRRAQRARAPRLAGDRTTLAPSGIAPASPTFLGTEVTIFDTAPRGGATFPNGGSPSAPGRRGRTGGSRGEGTARMAAAEAGRLEVVADEDLIERVVAHGDRAAFDRLYERYFPRVFAFVARRIANRADVEETVQEVFIGVFSGL